MQQKSGQHEEALKPADVHARVAEMRGSLMRRRIGGMRFFQTDVAHQRPSDQADQIAAGEDHSNVDDQQRQKSIALFPKQMQAAARHTRQGSSLDPACRQHKRDDVRELIY